MKRVTKKVNQLAKQQADLTNSMIRRIKDYKEEQESGMPLTWTRTKPTKAGWYWQRVDWPDGCDPRIGFIRKEVIKRGFAELGWDQWYAGPIPEPKEAK